MKIAISAQGKELDSKVDPRFGRAPFYIIYDLESGDFEALDNSENVHAGQGAGIQAAQKVVAQDVDLVVSGNLGPKAYQVLSSAKIKTALWAHGSVQEAVELAKNNELTFAEGANVEGHWS